MKRSIFSLLLLAGVLFFASSCNNSKKMKATENNEAQITEEKTPIPQTNVIPRNEPDFYAWGEDDTWKIEVRYDIAFVFADPSRNINYFSRKLEKTVAQGADVVSVFSEDDNYSIMAVIDVTDCGNYGKNVSVTVTNKRTKTETEYSTCGYYRGNMFLQSIWTVEEINGENIKIDKFPKEPPHFYFDLDDRQMNGFAGCNQVNGQLYFDYNHLIIEPLISTRMYCSEFSEIEETILKILRNRPVYKVENLVLTLQTKDGILKLRKSNKANQK